MQCEKFRVPSTSSPSDIPPSRPNRFSQQTLCPSSDYHLSLLALRRPKADPSKDATNLTFLLIVPRSSNACEPSCRECSRHFRLNTSFLHYFQISYLAIASSSQVLYAGQSSCYHKSGKAGEPNRLKACPHTSCKSHLNSTSRTQRTDTVNTCRFMWGIVGCPLGIYNILQNLSTPLVVQPQLFGKVHAFV